MEELNLKTFNEKTINISPNHETTGYNTIYEDIIYLGIKVDEVHRGNASLTLEQATELRDYLTKVIDYVEEEKENLVSVGDYVYMKSGRFQGFYGLVTDIKDSGFGYVVYYIKINETKDNDSFIIYVTDTNQMTRSF